MDKDEKLTITAGDVLRAAEKCGTAKEVLKEMFPKVFEDEWEIVPVKELDLEYLGEDSLSSDFIRINHSNGEGVILLYNDGQWINNGGKVKIDHGKLWRKKA